MVPVARRHLLDKKSRFAILVRRFHDRRVERSRTRAPSGYRGTDGGTPRMDYDYQ